MPGHWTHWPISTREGVSARWRIQPGNRFAGLAFGCTCQNIRKHWCPWCSCHRDKTTAVDKAMDAKKTIHFHGMGNWLDRRPAGDATRRWSGQEWLKYPCRCAIEGRLEAKDVEECDKVLFELRNWRLVIRHQVWKGWKGKGRLWVSLGTSTHHCMTVSCVNPSHAEIWNSTRRFIGGVKYVQVRIWPHLACVGI